MRWKFPTLLFAMSLLVTAATVRLGVRGYLRAEAALAARQDAPDVLDKVDVFLADPALLGSIVPPLSWLGLVFWWEVTGRYQLAEWRRRRADRRRNFCRGCGYDLRASSLQCPECGMHRPA